MSGSSGKTILANIPAREWRGLVPEWAGGRLRVGLQCSKCGAEDHWTATRVINPNAAIPKIIQLGWSVGGKLLCPACVRGRNTENTSNTEVLETLMNNVTKLETPKLVDEQKKNKRIAILALEEDFDEAGSRYRPGKSDKTLAEGLGLSVGFIRTVREEFYGPMGEPDEIGELRSEIATIHKLADELSNKLTGLCNRNGWRV